MKICLSFNVIPKGLKLKKNAQIGEKSTQFIQEWNRIMSNAEKNLLETLANEYYIVTYKRDQMLSRRSRSSVSCANKSRKIKGTLQLAEKRNCRN